MARWARPARGLRGRDPLAPGSRARPLRRPLRGAPGCSDTSPPLSSPIGSRATPRAAGRPRASRAARHGTEGILRRQYSRAHASRPKPSGASPGGPEMFHVEQFRVSGLAPRSLRVRVPPGNGREGPPSWRCNSSERRRKRSSRQGRVRTRAGSGVRTSSLRGWAAVAVPEVVPKRWSSPTGTERTEQGEPAQRTPSVARRRRGSDLRSSGAEGRTASLERSASGATAIAPERGTARPARAASGTRG